MRKTYSEPPKMPGYPKPRPEVKPKPAATPVTVPVAPARMRLGWSRGIVDQARVDSAPMPVTRVRSSAALRARAGECYRPPVRPMLVDAAPAVRPPVALTIPVPRRRETEPLPEAPTFFSTAWGAIVLQATGTLRFLAGAPRISDQGCQIVAPMKRTLLLSVLK